MRFRLWLALSLILLSPLGFAWFLSSVEAQPAVLVGKTWGGPQDEYGSDMTLDYQGNVYITGGTFSFGGGSPARPDAIILKFDPAGKLLWQRIWGGSNASDIGYGIGVDSTGNVYATGVTESYGYGGADVFILKINASGNLLWQKTWGGATTDIGADVAVDQTGIYVSAQTDSAGAGNFDVALLKLSSAGDLLWQKTWGGLSVDSSASVAIHSNSEGIYATGSTANIITGDADTFILKFDSSGNLLWQKTWGSGGLDYAYGVAVDSSSGAVYVTGATNGFGAGSPSNFDAFLLKFDPTSGLLWQRTWGETDYDSDAYAVAVDPYFGDIYITGERSPDVGGSKVYVLRINSAGGFVSIWNWGGIMTNRGLSVALDSLGNVHATGYVCCEGGPYPLGSVGNTTLGTPAFGTMLPTYSLGTSTLTLGSPPGSLSTPLGSETYAGGEEVFLFKYGLVPTIRFTTGTSSGTILFEGTTYSSGQSANYTYRSGPATANPPEGYTFTGWSVTGGVTVSNQTENPTTVTITGPGELAANFTPIPPTILGLPPILFYAILGGIIAAVVVVAFFGFKWYWRKRLASPAPQRL